MLTCMLTPLSTVDVDISIDISDIGINITVDANVKIIFKAVENRSSRKEVREKHMAL